MHSSTWQAVESQFAEFPILRAEAVPEEEIAAASAVLQVGFDADYRDFLARYGGAIVGAYRIFGLRRAKAMAKKEWTVVEATQHFREQGWSGVDEWYVFSMDHSGNPIGIAPNGRVMLSDHDAGEIVCLSDSFEDFIKTRCLR